MPLVLTATEVEKIADGVWMFDMPPHQVRHFGTPPNAHGARSILLLSNCTYSENDRELRFDLEATLPLNVGTTSTVIGIESTVQHSTKAADSIQASSYEQISPGDREFLSLAKRELSDDMFQAASQLLSGVREKSAGSLKRGKSRNFSETPDNFWYVIVQPRANELSLTVRGTVRHFADVAKLEIKDDRGNTRFKVSGVRDVPAALELIFHAIRKG